MTFSGWDDEGNATFDTKEAAIEWAKNHKMLAGDDLIVYVQREWCPMWLAHMLKGTPLEWIAYETEYDTEKPNE